MRFLRLVLVPSFLLMSVACFEGQRTFKINADGSGTIVDNAKLGAQAQSMLEGLNDLDKTSPAEKKAKQTAKFAEKAAAMGEGVTYVSNSSTKEGGEVTTYAFKDITKVRTSAMPSPNESTSSKDEPATFRLVKNAAGNTVLTITEPKETPSDPAAQTPAAKSPEQVQQEVGMMKRIMAGLKVRSVVEVNGAVVKTTSPYVVGSTVTLLDIDFDAIDEASLKKMAAMPRNGPPPAALLKGIRGIKVTDPEVTIEFKGVK